MNDDVNNSFDALDSVSTELAVYVAGQQEQWKDGDTILYTIKASTYVHGLKSLWLALPSEEKVNIFITIERFVSSTDAIKTIWCTGFLEALIVAIDKDELPKAGIIDLLGVNSLQYINALNAYHGIPPLK